MDFYPPQQLMICWWRLINLYLRVRVLTTYKEDTHYCYRVRPDLLQTRELSRKPTQTQGQHTKSKDKCSWESNLQPSGQEAKMPTTTHAMKLLYCITSWNVKKQFVRMDLVKVTWWRDCSVKHLRIFTKQSVWSVITDIPKFNRNLFSISSNYCTDVSVIHHRTATSSFEHVFRAYGSGSHVPCFWKLYYWASLRARILPEFLSHQNHHWIWLRPHPSPLDRQSPTTGSGCLAT